TNSVESLQVGMDGVSASFGASGAGVALTGGSLGLYMARQANGQTGYALVASGAAALSGFAGVSLSATASVRINAMGAAVSQSITVGNTTLAIAFANANAVQEVAISSGTLSVDGLGSLSGALAIKAETSGTGANAVTTIRIGLTGISGALTPGGVAATLSNGRGAILLKKTGAANGSYAVQVEGDVSLSGVSGITLQATSIAVAYNRMGVAIENEVVATGNGNYIVNLLNNESRLRGNIQADIAGVLSVSGDLFIESRSNQSVLLSNGSTVAVDQLIVGGVGVAAVLGNSSVGANLSGLDIAVVFSTERVSGNATARRWLTSKASIGAASIQGYALADIRTAALNLNSQLVDGALVLGGSDPVIDWNGSDNSQSTSIAISPERSVALADGLRVVQVALDASLVLGTAKLSGAFNVVLEQSSDGAHRAWHIVASGVAVGMEANGARVGLSNGSGELWLGKDNVSNQWGADQRSGTLTGTASATGVDGLTLSGSFVTRFDSQGNLELAGAVDVNLASYATLSGNFCVSQSAIVSSTPSLESKAAEAGASASISEAQAGGVQTDSVYHLDVASADGLRVREGAYVFAYNAATATVSLLLADSDATWQSRLKAA
ncbi:MAG: hypothetical protein ACR2I0_10260, partial [Rhodoferax sp.]